MQITFFKDHVPLRPTKVVAVVAISTIAAFGGPLLAMPSAGAATITVTATADGGSGSGSLRDAIAQANIAGGANTIVLASNQIYNLTDCHAGALNSTAGPLTIQANGSTIKQTCPFERVLRQSNLTALLISGATITGGSGVVGGGGIDSAGPVTLTNSTISGNSASSVGGGLATTATIGVTLVNSHIDGNSAPAGGGVSAGGPLDATDSTISGNTGPGLGSTGSVTLLRSNVDKNTLGGIETTATISLTNSTVSNNTNGAGVGGMFAVGNITVTESKVLGNTGQLGGILSVANLTLTRSTVSGNTGDNGGGVTAAGVTLDQSTVSSNRAVTNSAGITGTNVQLTNSTVANNTAGATDAGINAAGTVRLDKATIANNTAGNGTTGVRTPLTLQSFGSVIGSGTGGVPCTISAGTNTQGYNFEQGANSCGFGAGAGDVVNGPDPLLLPLGDNGGMTNTMLFATVSPLKSAIPLASPACTGTDQRGFTRPQGAGCDIGAVEMRVPVAINGNVTTDAGVSVTVDLHNFVTDADGWLAGATYTVGPQATSGFADAIGAGEVVYSPNPGFAGSDAYGYQVCDSQKITCIGATIFVTVNGVAAIPLQPIVAAPAFAG